MNVVDESMQRFGVRNVLVMAGTGLPKSMVGSIGIEHRQPRKEFGRVVAEKSDGLECFTFLRGGRLESVDLEVVLLKTRNHSSAN